MQDEGTERMSVQEGTDSWERAVAWYRASAPEEDVKANYFDLPVSGAAERYRRSSEFRQVAKILKAAPGRKVLDVGAGNGIASYALAMRGWQVDAIEPDPSAEVGAAAIEELARRRDLSISVHRSMGEGLPLKDSSVHAVHARQVLHHLDNLSTGMREMERVLVPGGLALCTREHVVDDNAQLEAFLVKHPLHYRYGGENAYSLETYLSAAQSVGLRLARFWGPLESAINGHPMSELTRVMRRLRTMGQSALANRSLPIGKEGLERIRMHGLSTDLEPGRLYSFLFRKPIGDRTS